METTSPTVVSATPSLAPPPQARRAHPLRWLGSFGPSGLLGLAVLLFWLLAALLGPWLLSHSAAGVGTSNVFAPISAKHWLGTDYLGRDMLALIIEGARYTIGVALFATLLASGTGTTLALLAASSGR